MHFVYVKSMTNLIVTATSFLKSKTTQTSQVSWPFNCLLLFSIASQVKVLEELLFTATVNSFLVWKTEHWWWVNPTLIIRQHTHFNHAYELFMWVSVTLLQSRSMQFQSLAGFSICFLGRPIGQLRDVLLSITETLHPGM